MREGPRAPRRWVDGPHQRSQMAQQGVDSPLKGPLDTATCHTATCHRATCHS